MLPHGLLIKIGCVGAVQMQPDKFGVANGVVLVRFMAVEKADLTGRGDMRLLLTGNGKPAVTNVEQHVVVIILPLDVVIIVGIVISAGRHIK